jgi:multidrug efflux pump
MLISDFCIRRPVFATVLSLIVVLIGMVSYTRLTIREYPRIDTPVVTVTSRYAGASAEVIETQVTKILEDSIAGIDAIDFITSISRAEQSQITVTFQLEKDPDSAAADVRDRVSRVRARLPASVDEPVVQAPVDWHWYVTGRLLEAPGAEQVALVTVHVPSTDTGSTQPV